MQFLAICGCIIIFLVYTFCLWIKLYSIRLILERDDNGRDRNTERLKNQQPTQPVCLWPCWPSNLTSVYIMSFVDFVRVSYEPLWTVYVCRHYFDMSPQIWSSKDVNSFRSRDELDLYIRQSGISCVFAVDAMLTYRLLKGRSAASESGVGLAKVLCHPSFVESATSQRRQT